MRKVFISYSSADSGFAEKLAKNLENNGLDVWFDKWEIRIGDSIIEKISQGLNQNDYLVVVLSPNSVLSPWVNKELNICMMREIKERNVVVLPILHKECEIPLFLLDKKIADFTKDYDRSIKELVLSISPEVFREKLKKQTGNIVGIDFGTSSSLVSIIENGSSIIIPNREGQKQTPSVVAFTANREWIVGEAALIQAETNPLNTFFSIKSKFGSDFTVSLGGIEYKSYELASKLFKKLKDDSEYYLGKEITKAVITCPAHFTRKQRHDLTKAAVLGGFEVLRLIPEPNAAILAYGLHKFEKNCDGNFERIAVYDFGGGTFDIAIAECGDGVLEILSLWSDTKLGGDDIDRRLLDYCLDTFESKTKLRIRDNPYAFRRILKEVEKAKIILSACSTARIYVPYVLITDNREFIDLDITVSIDIFEKLIADLIDRTIQCCKLAIEDFINPPYLKNEDKGAGSIREPQIDKVILSGLSSKMPLVRKKVQEFFEVIPICKIDPDEVVALGAALQAGVLEGVERESLMLDIASFSVGIELSNGAFFPIVSRQSSIPTYKYHVFRTCCCYDKGVVINVYEGEDEYCINNRYLGTLNFGIRSNRTESVVVLAAFDIDVNGQLNLVASEYSNCEKEDIDVYEMKPVPSNIIKNSYIESNLEPTDIVIDKEYLYEYREKMLKKFK